MWVAVGVLLPVTIGLGVMLGFDLLRRPILDIQLHNTYFVLRPWVLVLLVSLPLWLLVQLARGIWYGLRRLCKQAA
jgi:uncharacterized protein YneF (UPF0154 family)